MKEELILDMEPTQTILDVKEMTEEREGICSVTQKLYLDSVEMEGDMDLVPEDDKTLEYYAKEEEELHLIVIPQWRSTTRVEIKNLDFPTEIPKSRFKLNKIVHFLVQD